MEYLRFVHLQEVECVILETETLYKLFRGYQMERENVGSLAGR